MKKPTKAHATRIVHSDKNYPEKLRLLFWNLGNWIVTNDIKQLVLSRNEERMLHADLMNNPTHAPKLRKMMAAHAAFLPYWNILHPTFFLDSRQKIPIHSCTFLRLSLFKGNIKSNE